MTTENLQNKNTIFQKIKWQQIEFAHTLYELGGTLINQILVRNNEIELKIVKENLEAVAWLLKYNTFCQFEQLIEIVSLDTLDKTNRFKIVYCFLSLKYKSRINVSFRTDEAEPIMSLNYLFNSSCWLEREAFDMQGILFIGNSDLRRILNDYGFQNFPLRKDFPLTGQYEKQYYQNEKIIGTTFYNPGKGLGMSLRLQYQK